MLIAFVKVIVMFLEIKWWSTIHLKEGTRMYVKG